MTRDPITYDSGANLYSYVNSAPHYYTDPTGLRPIPFEFAAFIPLRLGIWLNEPWQWNPGPSGLGSGYQFRTDEREAGEPGSARIRSSAVIESLDIGRVRKEDINARQIPGTSHRRIWDTRHEFYRYYSRRTDMSVDKVTVGNTFDCRTSPPQIYTSVLFQASAGYPFNPVSPGSDLGLTPNIDYKAHFEFFVVGKNRVKICVNGVRDDFPDYEAVVDNGILLYHHRTGWAGPGVFNLNWEVMFGPGICVVVNAETPSCCNED